MKLSEDIQARAEDLRLDGQTVMFVASDKEVVGLLGVADTIKDSAKEAVESLTRDEIEVIMLTGDNQTTAAGINDHEQYKLTEIFP